MRMMVDCPNVRKKKMMMDVTSWHSRQAKGGRQQTWLAGQGEVGVREKEQRTWRWRRTGRKEA